MRGGKVVSLMGYSFNHEFQKVQGLVGRLLEVEKLVDWEKFRPIISKLFNDNETEGGRPHTDEIVLLKSLVLQSWYNLSDEELEVQIADRLSFRQFLGFPESIPDYSTIWKFRERLTQTKLKDKLWDELQRQLDEKGFSVKKGVIQDASIIRADLGKKRYYKEKKAEKQGKKIEYTEKQESHIDKDGSFTVKNGQVDFGYKLHQKCDAKFQFIREIDVSTASLHDSKVDLSDRKDKKMYRDKGYAGVPLKSKSVVDKTMRKAYRESPLTKMDKLWNKRISKIRAVGERPFSVIKNVFHRGHTFLKNIDRIFVQQLFNGFSFNLYNLYTYTG